MTKSELRAYAKANGITVAEARNRIRDALNETSIHETEELDMQHITFTTGHVRTSPKSEVSSESIEYIKDYLLPDLPLQSIQLPVFPGYNFVFRKQGENGFSVDVVEEETSSPVLSFFGVVGRNTDLFNFAKEEAALIAGCSAVEPDGDWCGAVIKLSGLQPKHLELMGCIGDFERCFYWTWRELEATSSAAWAVHRGL